VRKVSKSVIGKIMPIAYRTLFRHEPFFLW
jgi:hypothetical protein